MTPDQRAAFFTDWVRRDPDFGRAQLAKEPQELQDAVLTRVDNGPQMAPSMWDALHQLRMQARAQKQPGGRRP